MSNLYVKLAKTNIKNNRTLYLPYILSGIVTVAMFYLILFLNGNKGLDHMPGVVQLRMIFALGVAVMGIFSYIFIFYTNSFIIKRRKREIGVYNILGMEKRHIAKVLGLETLYVAVAAIAGGLVAGIFFSRLMLMLLYRILQYKESIVFSVNYEGIEFTMVVFGILYFLTLVYNLMQIGLANPIELLRGGNVGEKEPKTKMLRAIIGAVCIIVAYYIAITTKNPLKVMSLFFIAVVLVMVGTYALFTAGSIALLKGMRNNHKFYYHPKHFTAVSGMIYRMKQNAAGLASICILSTMVLVMVSMTVSMYAGVDDELAARYPMEITLFTEYQNADVLKSAKSNITEDEAEAQIRGMAKELGVSVNNLRNYHYIQMNAVRDNDAFSAVDKASYDGQMSLLNLVTRDSLIAMDDEFTEENVPKVPAGKVCVYASREYDGKAITLLDHTYPIADTRVYGAGQDNYMASMLEGDYYVVVDSEETLEALFAEVEPGQGNCYRGVIGLDTTGTDKQKIKLGKEIRSKFVTTEDADIVGKDCYVESRLENKTDFFSVYGGFFFIGIYLGVIFLMVTVMIIFYKQISEGYEDKQRYEIMEKVGMSNQEVRTSIRSQVRIVFLLPLVTAAIHTLAAFPMMTKLLQILNLTNKPLFAGCLLATFVVFAIIYYIVFKITSRSYYRIVGNQI